MFPHEVFQSYDETKISFAAQNCLDKCLYWYFSCYLEDERNEQGMSLTHICVCTYIHVYMLMCVCDYIYIHKHTHTYTDSRQSLTSCCFIILYFVIYLWQIVYPSVHQKNFHKRTALTIPHCICGQKLSPQTHFFVFFKKR